MSHGWREKVKSKSHVGRESMTGIMKSTGSDVQFKGWPLDAKPAGKKFISLPLREF